MFPSGSMNNDRLISVCRLDLLRAESMTFQSLPGLGRTQIHVQRIGCCFGHHYSLSTGNSIRSDPAAIELNPRGNHDQKPTTHGKKTSDKVCLPAKEDAEAEGSGEEESDRQEGMTQPSPPSPLFSVVRRMQREKRCLPSQPMTSHSETPELDIRSLDANVSLVWLPVLS